MSAPQPTASVSMTKSQWLDAAGYTDLPPADRLPDCAHTPPHVCLVKHPTMPDRRAEVLMRCPATPWTPDHAAPTRPGILPRPGILR